MTLNIKSVHFLGSKPQFENNFASFHDFRSLTLFPFFLLFLGVPEKVENCTMKNHSLTGLLVDCAAPLNGVTMPIYIIEVFKAKTREKILSLTNRDRPTFILQDLSPQDYYDLFVYSKTTGGQSDPVSLKASLSPSPMTHNQMKQGKFQSFFSLLCFFSSFYYIIEVFRYWIYDDE